MSVRRSYLRVACAALVTLSMAAPTAPGSAATSPPRPISNDCSGGYVAFTFDDGPDVNTPKVMDKLLSLNLRGTFFVQGNKIETAQGRQIAQALASNGFKVQNHGYSHRSWTGASTGGTPMTESEVTDELTKASAAIVAAGLPEPTTYRPPYGDVNSFDDVVAQRLGLRIVMPWGTPSGNIVDTRDWTGITPDQIATNAINGYTYNGNFYPGIKADSIVSMHDGHGQVTLNTIESLQRIVDHMNSKNLCSTDQIRDDATGGYVPAPAPTPPTSGNLVVNPSLEQLRLNATPASEPVCFQHAGSSVANNTAAWTLVSDAHSGAVAQRVSVSRWVGGDRKLVLTQRGSEGTCLATAVPGTSMKLWVWYKGDWAYQGANLTKVSMVTYYRDSAGAWRYWQSGPLVPPSSAYNLAYFKTSPLPAGAKAVSYGLSISGVGTLTTDDYTMTAAE